MRTIPPRQRAALARRIAAGLPVWAVARGSGLAAADVGELMSEPGFRDLIGAWSEIFDLSPEDRSQRLVRLAHMVVERRMAMDCGRTAHFVLREARRNRDPVQRLARGFAQLVDMERHKAERFAAAPVEPVPPPVPPVEPPPVPPVEPPPGPPPEPPVALSPVAETLAAERMRPRPHPDDAMLWRRAGVLRQDMLDEQVLFGAVAEHDAGAWHREARPEVASMRDCDGHQVAFGIRRRDMDRAFRWLGRVEALPVHRFRGRP